MKCSIIIAVLDSHEIFRRQMLRFDKIMPPDFELIVLDDGSDIPLSYDRPVRFPFTLLQTLDKRPWTNNLARNRGAAVASGEYLLMMDIDHVLTPEILDRVQRFSGDMLKFHRQVADLDEHGEVRNLRERLAPPPNIFAIRKTLFEQTGGVRQPRIHRLRHQDAKFRTKYQDLVSQGKARPFELAETIYVVTEKTAFHKLKRPPRSVPSPEKGNLSGRAGDPIGSAKTAGVTSPPRELGGDWKSLRLEDWKGEKDHKYLNRDAKLAVNWRRLHTLLPEYLTPDRRRRFLDVGCGNGASLEILRHLGHDAEGLDFTPGLSDVEKTDWLYRPFIESQGLKCTVHDGRAIPYPFPDRRFDVVICYGAITALQPTRLWPHLLNEFARLAESCIVLGVNVGEVYDLGKVHLDEWRHPDFELTRCEGAVYKWRRKEPIARTAADPRRDHSGTRLPLLFSGSRERPVDV